jgi:hypothetical protein
MTKIEDMWGTKIYDGVALLQIMLEKLRHALLMLYLNMNDFLF